MKYDCLIIDDEKLLSESTCEYFNTFDVKTAWVSDAVACDEFFRENSATIILLDINLGGSSGFDLCKKLRKTLDVPILFISARTSDDNPNDPKFIKTVWGMGYVFEGTNS